MHQEDSFTIIWICNLFIFDHSRWIFTRASLLNYSLVSQDFFFLFFLSPEHCFTTPFLSSVITSHQCLILISFLFIKNGVTLSSSTFPCFSSCLTLHHQVKKKKKILSLPLSATISTDRYAESTLCVNFTTDQKIC